MRWKEITTRGTNCSTQDANKRIIIGWILLAAP